MPFQTFTGGYPHPQPIQSTGRQASIYCALLLALLRLSHGHQA